MEAANQNQTEWPTQSVDLCQNVVRGKEIPRPTDLIWAYLGDESAVGKYVEDADLYQSGEKTSNYLAQIRYARPIQTIVSKDCDNKNTISSSQSF
jgi:hypothetical protein